MDVIVLFSGGHDSAHLLKRAAPNCLAVFFDYGQEARLEEMRAALKICDDLGVELMVETMPKLACVDAEYSGRNLLMVARAMLIALSVEASEIQIGCTELDYDYFADCTPEFINSLSAATEEAYGVKVTSPLKERPSDPIEGTWSCYLSGTKPCGFCLSCGLGGQE